MRSIVLDASAVLAVVYRENGGAKVVEALADPDSTVSMSTLNWSEALDRLSRDGMRDEDAERFLGRLRVEIVDFTVEQARIAAGLRLAAPSLSLADRACLALASTRNAIAWTTDQAWAKQPLSVPVELLR